MSALGGMAAGAITAAVSVALRRVLDDGWRAATGEDPPVAENLTSDADLRDLFVWSALLLGSVALSRKLAGLIVRRLPV